MSDEDLKLLFHSLGEQVLESESDSSSLVTTLMAETLRFRKKFFEDTGVTLSLVDVRFALEGIESHLKGEELSSELTSEQKALAMILIDHMTIFRKV